MRPFLEMTLIGIDRSGENDQIRPPHTLLRISHIPIDRAQFDGGLEILNPPADAHDMIGQGFSPKDHPERPAYQPYTDYCDLLEMNCHGCCA
jgi:hypothetical protein